MQHTVPDILAGVANELNKAEVSKLNTDRSDESWKHKISYTKFTRNIQKDKKKIRFC